MQKAVQYKNYKPTKINQKTPNKTKTTTSGTKQAAGFHFRMTLILDGILFNFVKIRNR